jgi:hypothetical protein
MVDPLHVSVYVGILFLLVLDLENSLGCSGLQPATTIRLGSQIASRSSHNACVISYVYATVLLTKIGTITYYIDIEGSIKMPYRGILDILEDRLHLQRYDCLCGLSHSCCKSVTVASGIR